MSGSSTSPAPQASTIAPRPQPPRGQTLFVFTPQTPEGTHVTAPIPVPHDEDPKLQDDLKLQDECPVDAPFTDFSDDEDPRLQDEWPVDPPFTDD